MTFAMTFPPGTHAMWMRYYLGAGGINPDKDVALHRDGEPVCLRGKNARRNSLGAFASACR
ncbi:MAG: ABC transporter substrate-binding protein [Gammaproteobacteria bacterium]